jgi:hypothetical protein
VTDRIVGSGRENKRLMYTSEINGVRRVHGVPVNNLGVGLRWVEELGARGEIFLRKIESTPFM